MGREAGGPGRRSGTLFFEEDEAPLWGEPVACAGGLLLAERTSGILLWLWAPDSIHGKHDNGGGVWLEEGGIVATACRSGMDG